MTSTRLVEQARAAGPRRPPVPLRRIVTGRARSSRSSTAIELSKVGPETSASSRPGARRPRGARARRPCPRAAACASAGRRAAPAARAGCETASRRSGRRGSAAPPSATSAMEAVCTSPPISVIVAGAAGPVRELAEQLDHRGEGALERRPVLEVERAPQLLGRPGREPSPGARRRPPRSTPPARGCPPS